MSALLAAIAAAPVFALAVAVADVGEPSSLRSPAAFASIADADARSIAIFEEAGRVFQSPRCLNCHPASDRPTQTDAMRPHQPLVVRGDDGIGPRGGLRCAACHQDENFAPSGVPGNPMWSLAPASMAWQGRTLEEICVQLKNPTRNGGRDLDALIKHVSEDALVGWAWNPGAARTPAPGTQDAFGALVKAWVLDGAGCPGRVPRRLRSRTVVTPLAK